MISHPSVLILSPDTQLSAELAQSISENSQVRISAEATTLDGLNGHASDVVKDYDVVLFQTSNVTEADLTALRAIRSDAKSSTRLVAMAEDSLSISDARALSQAGADLVVPMAAASEEIATKIQLWLSSPANIALPEVRIGKVIAVAQARGGAGSTTIAVNLADAIAGGASGRKKTARPKVALVDFDLQFGTVGTLLDIPDQDGLLKLAMDGTIPDETFMAQALVRMPNGLDVMAAPSAFAPIDCLGASQVSAIVETLRWSHDYVVIDLPRALVGWIEPILIRADEVILATDISVSSIRHCRRLMDFFASINLATSVKVVVNRQRRPIFRSNLEQEASKVLGQPLSWWLPDDKMATKAADQGKPLSAIAPRSSLAKAVSRFARQTIALHEAKTLQAAKQE